MNQSPNEATAIIYIDYLQKGKSINGEEYTHLSKRGNKEKMTSDENKTSFP